MEIGHHYRQTPMRSDEELPILALPCTPHCARIRTFHRRDSCDGRVYESGRRFITLCGVNYEVWPPLCRLWTGAPLRDVAEGVGARFGFDVGDRDDARKLWDELWEVYLPIEPELDIDAFLDRALFITGGVYRAYYDLEILRTVCASIPLASCFECGSYRRQGAYWVKYPGPYIYCGTRCEKRAERKWHELKEARQQLKATRRLLRKPSEVEQLRQSRGEESPAVETPR